MTAPRVFDHRVGVEGNPEALPEVRVPACCQLEFQISSIQLFPLNLVFVCNAVRHPGARYKKPSVGLAAVFSFKLSPNLLCSSIRAACGSWFGATMSNCAWRSRGTTAVSNRPVKACASMPLPRPV